MDALPDSNGTLAPEPLVLLPGTLCDARVFAPLIRRLEPHGFIVPDMTGETTAPGLARKLLAALPPRFALAGFSLGGIVALEIVAQAPERVSRLALLGTTARPDPPDNHDARRDAVAKAERNGLASVPAGAWPLYVHPGRLADAALQRLLADMAETLGLAAFRSQSEVAIHRVDSRTRLADIAVPTLVLCGAEDRLCPPDRHREMAAAIPGAVLAVLPDCGHFALLEDPDAVANHLARWLREPVRADHARKSA